VLNSTRAGRGAVLSSLTVSVPLALLLSLSGLAVVDAGSGGAAAAAQAPTGRITVKVSAPKGVPATVTLAGPQRAVVGKDAPGSKASDTLALKPGRYRVQAPTFSYRGRLYAASTSQATEVLRAKEKARIQVRYRRVRAADRLMVEEMSSSSVTLAWKQQKSMTVALRRTTGDRAARTVRQGAPVKAAKAGAKAVDTKARPGATYTYALFTKVGGRWAPPVTLTVGMPTGAAGEAAYSASPSTVIVEPGDADRVTLVPGGVQVTLPAKRATPLLGAGFVLPASTVLPGGYLGVVESISSDGRTVTLTGGGLADAFDYFDVAATLGDLPEVELTPMPVGVGARKALDAYVASKSERERRGLPAGLKNCLGGSIGGTVAVKPTLKPGGHFKGGLKKKWGIPTGAWFDTEAKVTAGLSMDVSVNGSLSCGIPTYPALIPLTTAPVPISLYLAPVIEVNAQGSGTFKNIGAKVTGGFWVKGTLGLKSSVDAGLIKQFSPNPLTTVGTLGIGAQMGGEFIIGPGTGTPDHGAIAGINGTVTPLKLSLGGYFAQTDYRFDKCLKAQASLQMSLAVTAKAWLGSWSASASYSPEQLQGEFPYATWYWPTNCENLPPDPDEPEDTVVGPGVTLVDAELIGDPSQSDYLEGFVTGQKSWVASTGVAAQAVGTPDQFASTDLGGAGSAYLTSLAGADTYDAVGYHLTVVPQGDTLHVRYLFASEEYPEYVDAGFNDVMAVLVGGQNCAYVPGTSTPVSVDSVNSGSYAQYFIDNEGGAGYANTFDGLTVPLQCDVAVTPGQPVQVSISVADVGDGIYDSAVSLLDKGVWSD
jgi:hypothetical protein